MHDIRAIRENPQAFDAGLQKRGIEPQAARLIQLDEARRKELVDIQELQTFRNKLSKEIGEAKKARDEARAQGLMREVSSIKEKIDRLEFKNQIAVSWQLFTGDNSDELQRLLLSLPNIPADDVPVGLDERANFELRKIEPPTLTFKPRMHDELGGSFMDFESAVRMSGSRFVVLKGVLARLERALIAYMLDLHTQNFKYVECLPPLLVRDDAALGTGQLPKFAEDLFNTSRVVDVELWKRGVERLNLEVSTENPAIALERVQEKLREILRHLENREHYWLIPTSEVSLTNLVREQILVEGQLPLRFVAATPCFRAEAGAAGKDTRGMIRQHQFNKVELVSITTPEAALEEHERMTSCAEEVLKRLGLAYRVMLLSSGDMGFAARKTYDLEVWLPGQGAYREISSCSWCGDFQARRMNARYRPKEGKGTRFVHTLNGSGLAVGRTLIAVMENYQQADGSIVVPDVLRPYMGGETTIPSMVQK